MGIGVVALVAIIALVVFLNRGYGTVSYPAYKIATALYGACLAKSEPRIDAIQLLLSESEDQGDRQDQSDQRDVTDPDIGSNGLEFDKISQQERTWLQSIIDAAKSADWNTAATEAKRLMEDQNRSIE